jgi:Holliday junction resolvase RusA-like endonuclease
VHPAVALAEGQEREDRVSISFQVRGIPVPQGSAKPFIAGGRARLATKSAPLMAWRTAIATAASSAMRDEPVMDGPVTVLATFRLMRPVSAPKRVTVPATRPDLDKLVRALLDGITGVVVRDDALVVRVDAEKVYADDVYPPGVSVEVLSR